MEECEEERRRDGKRAFIRSIRVRLVLHCMSVLRGRIETRYLRGSCLSNRFILPRFDVVDWCMQRQIDRL